MFEVPQVANEWCTADRKPRSTKVHLLFVDNPELQKPAKSLVEMFIITVKYLHIYLWVWPLALRDNALSLFY